MYKCLRLIFFIGYLSAFQFSFTPYPYVSPGIQIGLTGDTKFFFSAQITGGYVPYDNIGAGITIHSHRIKGAINNPLQHRLPNVYWNTDITT